VDKVEYAIKNNIDFIICDHHNVGDELPPATAVLDPKRKDCSYPFKELSGCGVGFKLLQGYCIKQNLDQLKLFSYLDLLSVSIAADLVDMTGENRIFCYYGLKQLTENPKHGLKALLDVASIKTKPRIENIVFGLAPRINAAGRITHAHGALELLLAENEIEAAKAAQILNTTNTERKDYDHITLMEAVEILNADANHVSYHSTVVYKEDWHKGIVGIVASKLIEKYYKPTIVLTGANGKVAGSARSVDGFDVYEAISACAEVLEQFGGHKYAAGLTLKHENIEKFKQLFEKQVAKTLLPDQKIPKLDIDLVITPSDVNAKFFNIVEQMGPFGPGNMTPTFELRNCIVTDVRLLKEKHLKFWVYTDSSKKYKISAIAFNLGDKFEIVNSGLPINIAFHLMENDFQGNKSIELNVKDVKLSEKS
jgi:single-stranded-DNA-specific exonuclease